MDMHDLAQIILRKLEVKLEKLMSAVVDTLKAAIADAVTKIQASVAVSAAVRQQLADTQAQLQVALANAQDPADVQAITDAIASLQAAIATLSP